MTREQKLEETLSGEFSRLVSEYGDGERQNSDEAWNLIADFAVANSEAIRRALTAGEEARGKAVGTLRVFESLACNGRKMVHFHLRDSAHKLSIGEHELYLHPTPSPIVDDATIERILRDHINVDASGLSPAVASAYVVGFEEAAKAVIAALSGAREGGE